MALARALVFEPGLLLMDEPLGALDRALREQMKGEIRRLHQELGITILYVTHDQEEALTLSDRIALMNRGRIVQIGAPADLYERPRNRVRRRLYRRGLADRGHRRAVEGGGLGAGIRKGGAPCCAGFRRTSRRVKPAVFLLRPEKLGSVRPDQDRTAGRWSADTVYVGDVTRVSFAWPAEPRIVAKQTNRAGDALLCDPAMPFGSHWAREDAVLLAAETTPRFNPISQGDSTMTATT